MNTSFVRVSGALNAPASFALDTIRWVAAFLVLLTHINNRMFLSYAEVTADDRSPLLYVWTFVTGFGHPAVLVFFVLSGFLVGGPLLQRTFEGEAPLSKRYFIDRAARIYPVLLPAIAVTAIADFLGQTYDPGGAYPGSQHYGSWAFWGTVLNVQNLLSPYFGSNGPLGTLANEWWYYLTAPVLFLCLSRGMPGWVRMVPPALAAVVAMYFATIWPWHGVGLSVWLMGAAAYCYRRPVIKSVPVAFGLFAAIFIAVRLGIRAEALENIWLSALVDLVESASVVALLLAVREATFKPHTLAMKTSKFLAGFSYSLYAVHVPLITLVLVVMQHELGFGWESVPTPARIMVAIGLAGAVCACAWLLSLVTERNTSATRRMLYRFAGVGLHVTQRA